MRNRFDSIETSSDLRVHSRQMAISRFISRTYGWMVLGLLTTAVVSFSIVRSETALEVLVGNRALFYACAIGQVLLVLGLTAALPRLSATQALFGFLGYSALNGVVLSVIFLLYTLTSIAHVFVIAAGMFAGLALYGTLTRKDLTAVGSFVGMGLWGLLLVGLVNLFVGSQALSMGMAVAGVVIFSGLTAYDSQRIRAMAYDFSGGFYSEEEQGKGSILAALGLYLNFINLFIHLLRLFGNRRD
ncbi:MAG: Bax inhibitor-1/YccA family protein [Bdellovibrionia bacterium]